MAFHQQSFQNRLATMGDIAEGEFDRVYEGKVHNFGLNRVWVNGDNLYMNDMTVPMRYMPDRMTRDKIFEVMGCGRDQTLKLKVEKIQALQAWDDIGPTWLFVYDSSNHRYWEAPINLWVQAVGFYGELRTFPEGKEYWALHTDHFPTAPKDAPPRDQAQAPT